MDIECYICADNKKHIPVEFCWKCKLNIKKAIDNYHDYTEPHEKKPVICRDCVFYAGSLQLIGLKNGYIIEDDPNEYSPETKKMRIE